MRRYNSQDTVRSLFAVASSLEPASSSRQFDIMRTFPLTSLSDNLDLTIGEAGLSGSQVVMRWK